MTIGWQAIVRRKGYPSQTKTFRAKRDAEAWARSIETEMDRGAWRDRSEAESTTLGECIQRYLTEVTPRKKNSHPETLKLEQWLRRPLSKRFMASIRGKDVADVIKDMESEGKGGNTIRLHLAVFSHVFKVAKTEWGMESISNPYEAVRKPKIAKGRERRLVDDEEERLLAACAESGNCWLHPLVVLALETAMRSGELVETWALNKGTGKREMVSIGLQWSDVDLKKRTAHLPETKNDEARDVPLSSRAVATLEALPRNLDGRVFGTTYDGTRQAFVCARRRAGIEGLRFHDLRHEATSRLFEKGFNPMEVSAITGHKTLQMLKRYTHLRAEDLAKRMG
ncbi:site-specific integrase [Acidithiobacillus ferridurans]|nr:site-specific integrase [Acidithiobacillus ferridurans]